LIKNKGMPTVIEHKGYRFFFYINDHPPVHIHIEKDNKTAKFNLEPLSLVRSRKFNASEIKEIHNFIKNNLEFLKQKWDAYFNN